jgi:cellulose synthase/poly-beta-1,6-N-acetylglucosamine synthase-like glycosyltransferase
MKTYDNGILFCYNTVMEKGSIEKISLSQNIRVSVVIPHFYKTREENFQRLLNDLKSQSCQDMELIVVRGVSPQGKAINQGVCQAKGEMIVIIDDDSRMGHSQIIENLEWVLRANPSIGMAGASVVIPENANWFQRAASKQFPRFSMPIVKEVTDSDLPGHPCSAFPKEVFRKVGFEREDILRGLDPDLRVRIRKAGYRVVLAPDTWIYHPLPDSIFKFVRTFLRNGYCSAYLQLMHPEINYDTDEALDAKDFVPKRSSFHRFFRYPVRLIKSFLTLQWIRFLGYSVYVVGYAAGYLRFLVSRPSWSRR